MTSARNILPDDELGMKIDEMVCEHFKTDEPGAAIIVTRKGKPIFRKGYGLAVVEHDLPIEPHMVFRLGSITKQFTAVCILMLVEQGKVKLDDEITEYLTDYPTQAHRITVRQLLTHTSGIKSYTNVAAFMQNMRKDMSLDELINSFKLEPMEFAPDTSWNYNNSGYVMLGAIIEKVSGISYAEFLQKNIFEPLGMKHSCYDMPNPIIPGRVSGYKPVEDSYENADYISMTLPHAAGSLASNVDDMAAWDAALYTEKLVKQESLKEAWTGHKLKDGTSTGYGFGWAESTFQDHAMIMHGGGIPGFITDAIRFPNEQVYVCILTNRGREIPVNLAFRIGALVTGKPYEEPVAIDIDPAEFKRYEGMYRLDMMGIDLPVMVEKDKLVAMMATGSKQALIPVAEHKFASEASVSTIEFEMGEDGLAAAFTMRGFYGPGMHAVKTNEPLPSQRKTVDLDPSLYEQYTGEYEHAPGQSITVSFDDEKLWAQISGQPVFQLHAESEMKFFLKEAPVTIVFEKDGSKVTGLVIHQGGQEMPAKKLK